jgi:ComF family protein
VLPQLAKFKGAALNLLFPQRCLGCGREGELICSSCQLSLPKLVPPLCPKCGRPQSSGIVCPDCVSWKAHIDGIRSPFRFEGLARQAVHQLKYKNLRSLAQTLADLMSQYLAQNPMPADVIMPVPLHPRRLKERGYNQSALLAFFLAKSLGLPLDENCLARHKFLVPQARTQSVIERRRNVEEAFSCKNLAAGKQVLLVDDVCTSGATLDACAEVMKKSGVETVWALVFAREI